MFEVDLPEVIRVVVADTFNTMVALRARLTQHKEQYADVLAENERLRSSASLQPVSDKRRADQGFMTHWDALDNALLQMNDTVLLMQYY